jgi:Zn-dependent protease with chaperone function
MKYELLAICLILSAWPMLATVFALAGLRLWRMVGSRLALEPPREQARMLFALRVWPPAAAAAFVVFILLPAYILHEPEQTTEPVSLVLLIATWICIAGGLYAIGHMVIAFRRTGKLVAEWQHLAEKVSVTDAGIPVWRLRHPLPVIAVVGVFRPQLFIADQLYRHLNQDELDVVLRHEQWHLDSWDNLRRMVFTFCRHFLFFLPGSGELEREWQESVELAADDYAAGGDKQKALDLASALVRIARLFKPGVDVAMPAAFSFVMTHDGNLERRIQRLMKIADGDERQGLEKGRGLNLAFRLMMVFLPFTMLLTGLYPGALHTVHQGIELIVGILP